MGRVQAHADTSIGIVSFAFFVVKTFHTGCIMQ